MIEERTKKMGRGKPKEKQGEGAAVKPLHTEKLKAESGTGEGAAAKPLHTEKLKTESGTFGDGGRDGGRRGGEKNVRLILVGRY